MGVNNANDRIYTALLAGSLRLSRLGEWWHNGSPFTNAKVAQLFHHSILWDRSRTTFVIRLANQQATFETEDTAYFVNHIETTCTPWQITLNDGRVENLAAASLCVGTEGQFYCVINARTTSPGATISCFARFSRSAHQVLLQYAEDEHSLRISGHSVTPPLRANE